MLNTLIVHFHFAFPFTVRSFNFCFDVEGVGSFGTLEELESLIVSMEERTKQVTARARGK